MRLDSEPETAEGLLPGLVKAHLARTKPFLALMKASKEAAAKAAVVAAAIPAKPATKAANIAREEEAARKSIADAAMEDLQLLLAAPSSFKLVKRGVYEPSVTVVEGEVETTTKERVTWRLQRAGRIRMPYAADLLDRYVNTINKLAFDVDYIARGKDAAAAVPATGVATAAATGAASL